MLDKPDSLHTLGLESEGEILRGAQLSMIKGKPKLERIFELAVDNVKPLYTTDEGGALEELLKKNLAVTTLPASEVLIRPLEVKLKKQKDIDAVLGFQSEPLLPYPLENAVIDRIVIGPTQEGTQLTVLAARKDHLQQHLAALHHHQIEPEVVACAPSALVAFGQFFTTKNNYYILHLGRKETVCVLVMEGKLIAAQTCHFSYESPELRTNVIRTLYSLAKQTKGKDVLDILFTGEGSRDQELTQVLAGNLGKSIVKPDEKPHFTSNEEQLLKYAIPIGSALTGLPEQEDVVNFRQQEFAYPNPWKRYKQPICIYLGLCIFLAISVFLFGEAYMARSRDEVRQEYVALLSTMNKPYSVFEAEYSAKFPSENQGDEVRTVMSLDDNELLGRLNYLEKELQGTPDMFPLLPNVPRVSDVLAWISNHPNVLQKESLTPLIQVENFAYTVVKRPEQTKKNERYQVKVDLEFSTSTPKLAREFHDALIAPNEIVDPKGEVKWSSNRGKYKTSFFLKDKTIYPSLAK